MAMVYKVVQSALLSSAGIILSAWRFVLEAMLRLFIMHRAAVHSALVGQRRADHAAGVAQDGAAAAQLCLRALRLTLFKHQQTALQPNGFGTRAERVKVPRL